MVEFGKIRYAANVTCRECGREFRAEWDDARSATAVPCPDGHQFEAEWPGFEFEPITVIVERDPDRQRFREIAAAPRPLTQEQDEELTAIIRRAREGKRG